MHTVELLEQALRLAERLGYQVREDWLGGSGGGACELRGRKMLMVDLALGPEDQLDRVIEALQGEPEVVALPMPRRLHDALAARRTA